MRGKMHELRNVFKLKKPQLLTRTKNNKKSTLGLALKKEVELKSAKCAAVDSSRSIIRTEYIRRSLHFMIWAPDYRKHFLIFFVLCSGITQLIRVMSNLGKMEENQSM